MKETPILFSGPMVRAILDGRKTQTRRVVKPQPEPIPDDVWKDKRVPSDRQFWWPHKAAGQMVEVRDMSGACPYGHPGDKLWCKETWRPHDGVTIRDHDASEIEYRATDDRPKEPTDCHWKPSIFMPRWASRITLEITSARVDRLHDISEDDAKEEGIPKYDALFKDNPKPFWSGYCAIWQSINGPGSWDANPWVWVIEFRRVEK